MSKTPIVSSDSTMPSKHNWKALLSEFELDFTNCKVSTMKEFAINRGLNYTLASREFSALKKERAKTYIEAAQGKLAEGSFAAANRLVSLADSEDENVAVKASVAVLDRVGISPAVAQVNVTQQVQNNLVLPPMFLGSAQADVTRLLSGEE